MLILSPNEIKEEKKENIVQTQKRNISLANEEAKLNRDINLTKQNADKKKEEISKDVAGFMVREKAKVENLTREVALLELQKKEALKPVDDIKKELEDKVVILNEKLEKVETGLNQNEKDHETNLDNADTIKDLQEDIEARDEKLKKKEQGAKSEEERLRKSNDSLTDAWVKLHEATSEANTDIDKKSSEIGDRETVLEIRGEEQDKRQVEQNNHDRQIKDKYETLGRAIEFAKEKYNINI